MAQNMMLPTTCFLITVLPMCQQKRGYTPLNQVQALLNNFFCIRTEAKQVVVLDIFSSKEEKKNLCRQSQWTITAFNLLFSGQI